MNPFFRHAAYQAIDHILLRLEAEGDAQDLERLKRLVPGPVDAPCQQKESLEEQGICRRVQWTIAQLAAQDASANRIRQQVLPTKVTDRTEPWALLMVLAPFGLFALATARLGVDLAQDTAFSPGYWAIPRSWEPSR